MCHPNDADDHRKNIIWRLLHDHAILWLYPSWSQTHNAPINSHLAMSITHVVRTNENMFYISIRNCLTQLGWGSLFREVQKRSNLTLFPNHKFRAANHVFSRFKTLPKINVLKLIPSHEFWHRVVASTKIRRFYCTPRISR